MSADEFEEVLGKILGIRGVRVGLQPGLVVNGEAKKLVYNLTKHSEKNPNISKSLVNFYKKALLEANKCDVFLGCRLPKFQM